MWKLLEALRYTLRHILNLHLEMMENSCVQIPHFLDHRSRKRRWKWRSSDFRDVVTKRGHPLGFSGCHPRIIFGWLFFWTVATPQFIPIRETCPGTFCDFAACGASLQRNQLSAKRALLGQSSHKWGLRFCPRSRIGAFWEAKTHVSCVLAYPKKH